MSTTADFAAPSGPDRNEGLAEAAAARVLADASDEVEADPVTPLLAALLTPALGTTATQVADALLATFGSLAAVLNARPRQLSQMPGMCKAAASLINSAAAIGRRAALEQIRERDLLDDHGAVELYLRSTLRCRAAEEARGLFLDARNRLICDLVLSRGTVSHTPLYPREVVRHALLLNASALILAHNHPSGDPSPSVADIATSRRIAQALAAVNVALHDHLIVGDNRIESLRTRGVL
jgi:DNA repair protein RadC